MKHEMLERQGREGGEEKHGENRIQGFGFGALAPWSIELGLGKEKGERKKERKNKLTGAGTVAR